MHCCTSTKDGETKYLEAKPQNGQYITDGYFDQSNTNYIPETIAVEYSKKSVKVNDAGGTDVQALKAQLAAQGISIRNESTTEDGTVSAQVVLGEMMGAIGDVYLDAAISEFEDSAGIDKTELNKWLGVYQKLDELSSYNLKDVSGQDYTLYLDSLLDSETYLVIVHNATSNKYTKMLITKAAQSAGSSLRDISDAMSAANFASGALLEYNAISKDTSALREEIEAHPTMTQEQKAEANAKITALDRDKKLFLIGMTVIPMMMTAAGGAPLMISALLAGYSSVANYFWDYRVGMIKVCVPIDGAFAGDHGIPLTQEYIRENLGHISRNSGKYYLAEDINSLKAALKEIGSAVAVEYVTDMAAVASYGVMSTPALVVNEKVVSSGKVMKAGDVVKLLHKLGF